MNGILNMILQRVLNLGVRKGIDVASRKGKTAQEMTPQERQNAKSLRKNANTARQSMNILRRFMR